MPLCYQYTGALTADILTQNNIIFKNTLELTATNNSLLVSKSTTIDPAIKEKLKNIQGILYLSRVAGKYSNIHLMTSRATTLDGIERIGYIRGQKDAIQFTEYPRGKNVHYSAFYPYVKNLLQNNGFYELNNIFTIPSDKIDHFVNIINDFIRMRETENFRPIIGAKIDTLMINERKYFYNTLYWETDSTDSDIAQLSLPSNSRQIHIKNIKHELSALGELCRIAENENMLFELKKDLQAIRQKLTSLDEIAELEIQQLKEYKNLTED